MENSVDKVVIVAGLRWKPWSPPDNSANVYWELEDDRHFWVTDYGSGGVDPSSFSGWRIGCGGSPVSKRFTSRDLAMANIKEVLKDYLPRDIKDHQAEIAKIKNKIAAARRLLEKARALK